jgi:membrane-bound lytic murein transglycosylase B
VTGRGAVVAAFAAVTALVAAAAGPAGASPVVPAPAPPVGQGLSPEVDAVPASSRELDAARAAEATVTARLERDQRSLEQASAELEQVGLERTGVAGLVARRTQQVDKATADLGAVRHDLRALATEWFVTGFGDLEALDPTLSADRVAEIGHQRVLAEAAAADALASDRFVSRRLGGLRDELATLTRRLGDLDRRATATTAERDRLQADAATDLAAAAQARDRTRRARLNATVDGTDMSTIALDAYWRAAQDLARTDPRCGMTWWALAGIGRTESRHGTYLGSTVGVDGVVSSPILGPPLDGSNGFAVVPDTDGGRLDGDPTTDRAVGPMQFLPSTWKTVGRDGSGDGVADPQNLYDAALGAGAYLCRSGPVSDDAGLRRAYYSYNRSQSYVDIVVQRADEYRSAVPLA